MNGVLRTRVGYSGGSMAHPTYHDLGDHSESVQIDFDPTIISYEDLLRTALSIGDFQGVEFSRQYRSVVFYHNKPQLQAARALGVKKLEPFGTFTRAEDYHQKYYLQQRPEIAKEFYARYPTVSDFTDSLAVTKANGIVGGYNDSEEIRRMIPSLSVTADSAQKLLQMAGTSKSGCAAP